MWVLETESYLVFWLSRKCSYLSPDPEEFYIKYTRQKDYSIKQIIGFDIKMWDSPKSGSLSFWKAIMEILTRAALTGPIFWLNSYRVKVTAEQSEMTTVGKIKS